MERHDTGWERNGRHVPWRQRDDTASTGSSARRCRGSRRGRPRRSARAGASRPRATCAPTDRIRDDVIERIARDTDVDASEVEIHVENGDVTLTGMVEDRAAKRELEDVAES